MNILKPEYDSLEITYSEPQNEIFFEDLARFRIVPKGRRTGYTHGVSGYASECCLDPSVLSYQFPGVSHLKILWVDTIQGNIDRYVERYFLPILKPMEKKFYQWRQQKKELQILNSYIDFRSADRPENIEGFGYHLIILNEAGIILKGEKGRYLWENALLPMMSDFGALVIAGGTPKGKTDKKTAKPTLYYTLAKRGESSKEEDRNFSTKRLIPEENPFLSQIDVKMLREELKGSVEKQEMDGLFVDIGTEGVFLAEWFIMCEKEDLPERFDNIFTSWDTAFGDGEENDYSVCTLFGVSRNKIYILDWWEGKVNFPGLKEKWSEIANREEFRPWLSLIEGKATGDPLLDEIENSSISPTERIIPKGDKVYRANSITPYFQAGKVIILNFPESSRFKTRLKSFPEGGRDTTDTVSQGINYIRENNTVTLDNFGIMSAKARIKD